MENRKKILLFNPKTVFFDMPLALLALGSALDQKKFKVIIVDARVETDALEIIQKHIKDSFCFAVTTITGISLKECISVTNIVKDLVPEITVVWGGWHTSIFPKEVLEDQPWVDITVQGQGEITFQKLIDCLVTNKPFDNIKGIAFRKNGRIIVNPTDSIAPMDSLEKANYDLIDVEKYFAKKGKRQFDYISSIGCFNRCAFCADPLVYKRQQSSKSSKRMTDEIVYYYNKYHFTDINFQDETFFSFPRKIEEFAENIISSGINFTWAATMRANQGAKLSDSAWLKLKKSGLRRLLIGVETGSQDMMDWLKKDIKLSQVFFCADKCKEHEISAIFPFIIGFPDETDESVHKTREVIKKLRSMNSSFKTPIFHYLPYPGSEISMRAGNTDNFIPSTTQQWSNFDFENSTGPWVSKNKKHYINNFEFYLNSAFKKKTNKLYFLLKIISKLRCKYNFYRFPLEKIFIDGFKKIYYRVHKKNKPSN